MLWRTLRKECDGCYHEIEVGVAFFCLLTVQEIPPRSYYGAGEEDGNGCQVYECKRVCLISLSHQFKPPQPPPLPACFSNNPNQFHEHTARGLTSTALKNLIPACVISTRVHLRNVFIKRYTPSACRVNLMSPTYTGHLQALSVRAQDEAGLAGPLQDGPEEAEAEKPGEELFQVRGQGERGETCSHQTPLYCSGVKYCKLWYKSITKQMQGQYHQYK